MADPLPPTPSQRGPRGLTLRSTVSDALTPVEEALDRFFRGLEERGVPILALRGARTAPRLHDGGDLDLACAPRDRRTVEAELRRQLRTLGVTTVSTHRSDSLTQLQLYAPCGPGRHHHLCVDLHTRETCFGVPFLSAQELFEGRNRTRRPERPAAVPGALLNFLTPFLSGGHVNPEYATRLAVVADKHPAQFREFVGRIVGTGRADRFIEALRGKSFGALAREARPFRRSLLLRAFVQRPVRSIRGLASCLWSARITPLFAPRGMTVALLGTDGSGKTTLAQELHAELASAFRASENRTIKLRPGLLPQLGRLLGRRPTEEEYARPHRAAPSGAVMTWLRATYYWLDYWLGYGVKVLPLRRRNALILFDRWIDDWLVDPARYRMRAGSRYVALLVRLAPRPDATLVTTAPLRIVAARKQELSQRESLRQLEAYEAFAAAREHVYVVSTTGSVDDAVDQALLALFKGSHSHVAGVAAQPMHPRRAA